MEGCKEREDTGGICFIQQITAYLHAYEDAFIGRRRRLVQAPEGQLFQDRRLSGLMDKKGDSHSHEGRGYSRCFKSRRPARCAGRRMRHREEVGSRGMRGRQPRILTGIFLGKNWQSMGSELMVQ